MKKVFIVGLFFLCLLGLSSCGTRNKVVQSNPSAKETEDWISGTWSWASNAQEADLPASFEFQLKLVNGKITGRHISWFTYGQSFKLDATVDGDTSITGTVNGNVATVQLKCSFGGEVSAKIRKIDDNVIEWKVIQGFNEECYIPHNAVLKRSGN